MPQNAPIVLKDASTTPVDHTFTPKGQTGSNGEFVFRDTVAGIPEGGQVKLSVFRRPDNSQLQTDKVSWKLEVPKVVDQTVNGVVSKVVVYTNLCNGELVVAKLAADQEVKDMLAFNASLLGTAFFKAIVVNREAIW